MSLPKYPAYKDSGVSWLGEVPAHWEVKRLKQLIRGIESGVSVNAIDVPAVGSEIGVLKTSCVSSGFFDPTENKAVLPEEYGRVSCPVRKDTLIVSRMNTPALVGAAGLVTQDHPDIFLPDRLWQVEFKEIATAFLHYWTQNKTYRSQVEMACSGTSASMQNLGQDQFGNFWLACPYTDEAVAIAEFLDRETAKIDALIAEQEKLIALLAEKRQASISRAVTRGLDPNVPLKDSGVPWLGKVPAHWEVLQIKRLSPVQRGASPRPIDDPKFFDDDGDYSWVRIADVSASDGFLNETTQRMSLLGSSLSVKIEPGELFVSIAGTVGKPCISNIKACIHDGFVYFPKLSLNPRFLFRVFEAGQCYAGLGKFGTQLNLNTDTIGSIKLAVPSDGEVTEICKFLDFELGKIDELLSEQEKAVALLKERRASLISAAVTGKVDVRGLAA